MITRKKFEFIKKKYGHYASWAIWADFGEKPKENVGNLSVFDIEKNPRLLKQLKTNIILVGLNISRVVIKVPFANFHDAKSKAMDFKIRYALRGSPFWGAYMTDIIKNFDQKESGKVISYLRTYKQFEEKNIQIFRKEMKDIGADNPTVIALGNDAYMILNRKFKNEYKILKIPHYSKYISKEKYREEVQSALGF